MANEPSEAVTYTLGEALTLLAALEYAQAAPIESDRLAVVVMIENEIRLLGR